MTEQQGDLFHYARQAALRQPLSPPEPPPAAIVPSDENISDPDYWKKAYCKTWDKAGRRVMAVRRIIRERTGRETEFVGFGAGSNDFISGSAAQHGYEKGGADLRIVGTSLYVEVTGPLNGSNLSAALWIRPDKIRAARAPNKETWVLHLIELMPGYLRIRTIHLGETFFRRFYDGSFRLVRVEIRGRQERYFAIPAHDQIVRPLWCFLDRVKRLAEYSTE